MRTQPRPARSKPHFFWQGALIILPALVLAAACLYSLKQDHVVAEHELQEEAGRLAEFIAQQFVPRALRLNLPWSLEATVTTPEQDPIVAATNSPAVRAACFLDDKGDSSFPPAFGPIPTPAPYDLGELTPEQQDAWLALEKSWSAGMGDIAGVFENFAARRPPERFTFIARFRTAVALRRSGQGDEAVEWMAMAARAPDMILAESGVPLADVAMLQLVGWLPEGTRGESVNRLAPRLIAQPSPIADAFWERLPMTDPAVARWIRVKAAHDRARALQAAITAAPEDTSVSIEGESLYLIEVSMVDKRWILAVSLDALSREIVQLERETLKPEHLTVAVRLGEQSLVERPADKAALATATHSVGGGPLTVEVFLTNPDSFHAQRRARAVRFAALIGLSAIAVLVGFISAWRSFRREQQLGEMKTNFVSSVSHELRAPIASVRLMAEELELGTTPDAAKLNRYHRFIAQECRRLSAVIENVLDFARREQGRERFEFESTDLERLVSDSVELMRPCAGERDVLLEYVRLGAPEEIEADGHALQRALVNLIDNAIKHSPDGSSISVALEFAGDRVFICVEDRGPGIPSEEQGRIFDRFYRIGSELRRETQGIGLGLAIVKHLAEVHGGRVLLRSRVGEGSRFTIELPHKRPTPTNAMEVNI